MTIFNLLLYTCVRFYSPTDGDELLGMTCRWQPSGAYYVTRELCEAHGFKEVGHPIFSDIADGRQVEKTRCDSMSVVDR